MSYQLEGKLWVKYNIVQRSESFKTRDFIVAKTEDVNGRVVTNYIKFTLKQDTVRLLDKFEEGSDVTVSFNLKGTRWEKDGKVNYITSLDAWKIS